MLLQLFAVSKRSQRKEKSRTKAVPSARKQGNRRANDKHPRHSASPTTPYPAEPHRTTSCRSISPVLYHTVPSCTLPCQTLPYRIMLYSTLTYVPYGTIPYRTIPHSTVLFRSYCIVPYRTVPYPYHMPYELYCTMPYPTIPHSTRTYCTNTVLHPAIFLPYRISPHRI